MKHQPFDTLSNANPCGLARGISKFGMAAAQAALIGLGAAIAAGQTVDSATDDQGAQVLTRGPVHEAFAGIVSYNPEPGLIVGKAPPEAIEELPPEIRPAGDNISWIPGYWGWDDERSDYLWISGTWRAMPPGRQWTTGYWGTVGQGYQWTSGYWADSSLQETAYLPKPPVTVEAGPNIEAPSRNHAWTPGSWMWNQERYAWRPGYWAEGRSDWDWIPAHYVWTPRGYVFVDGYWDYNFDRRGVLYAPVYFQSGYHSRPGYSYSPVIAIGLVALMEHLFLKPDYRHYYFGDYYDRSYRDRGYYSPYAYQSSRYGYDPVYSHRRWTHRRDRDWERRYVASYDYRRDHENARPPRTWNDQKRLRLDAAETREQRLLMATPFDQMAKQEDKPIRIERVAAKERQKLVDLSREVRKTREQRRALETQDVKIASDKGEQAIKPTKVSRLPSPIVGRSPDRFDKTQAPPKPQRNPSADPEKQKTDRQPDTEKTRPGREITPKPVPRQEPQVKEPKREPRQEPQVKEPKREPRQEPQVKEPKRETRQEPQVKEPKREPRQEPQVKEPKREPRQEPQVKETKRESRETSRRPDKAAPEKATDESKPKESGKRNEETSKPSSRGKSEADKEEAGKPSGKTPGKERK